MEDIQKSIIRNFEIQGIEDEITEKEFFKILTAQVEYMLDRKLDYLLSLLYRLDVEEYKIKAALDNKTMGSPAEVLARLIIDRQKQRNKTKSEYSNDNLNWDEF